MRVLGMALAGVLALIAPIAAHSASPGSNTGQTTTGPPPGIAPVWTTIILTGTRRPMVAVVAGIHRIGDRAVLMAGGSLSGAGSSHLLGLGSQRRRL